MSDVNDILWKYLSPDQRELLTDGETLIGDRKKHPAENLSDYSYLVFPFAKLYEGFLKRMLLDTGAIGERDFTSDHFRIGKVLSPNLTHVLGARSAYLWITRHYSETLADELWVTWKEGRNLIFHYFPHNLRKLSFVQATEIIGRITRTMEEAVAETGVGGK